MSTYQRNTFEEKHAKDAGGLEYGDESVIRLPDGREVRCPAYPQDCDYVRVIHEGEEISYWNSDEWRDDPCDVMGAIMGIMVSGMK